QFCRARANSVREDSGAGRADGLWAEAELTDEAFDASVQRGRGLAERLLPQGGLLRRARRRDIAPGHGPQPPAQRIAPADEHDALDIFQKRRQAARILRLVPVIAFY